MWLGCLGFALWCVLWLPECALAAPPVALRAQCLRRRVHLAGANEDETPHWAVFVKVHFDQPLFLAGFALERIYSHGQHGDLPKAWKGQQMRASLRGGHVHIAGCLRLCCGGVCFESPRGNGPARPDNVQWQQTDAHDADSVAFFLSGPHDARWQKNSAISELARCVRERACRSIGI